MNFEHSPLLQALESAAAKFPEKTFIISADGERISYATVLDNTLRAAAFLNASGIQPGDRIILSAQKEVEFVYFYFAAHMTGAVNVVTDIKGNSRHIPYILSCTTPALAIGAQLDGITSFCYDDIDLSGFGSRITPEAGLTPDTTADIMFTSGTTGNPKGVCLSHANIYSSAVNINTYIGNTFSDIELLALPVCHSFGLGRLRCNLLTGATIVLHNGFANLKSIFHCIEKYNITGIGFVPAVWAYIRKFSGLKIAEYASRLRYIEIGSAPMPADDKKLLARLFPDTKICMHYGLTEASRSLFMEFHHDAAHIDSIGSPVTPEVAVCIMDENSLEVPDGETGEICIKGKMVTTSYLDPADNINAFSEKGYFRTGDCGFRDSEGYFHLVSRIKELINVGGKKVSPSEIEDTLEEIGVKESLVRGMPDPDGILGEVPEVLLLKGSFTLPVETIRKEIAERLPDYKRPKIYSIVDTLPKTGSGKKIRTR